MTGDTKEDKIISEVEIRVVLDGKAIAESVILHPGKPNQQPS